MAGRLYLGTGFYGQVSPSTLNRCLVPEEIRERSRDETVRLAGLRLLLTPPDSQASASWGAVLQRLSTLLEHLRKTLQEPDLRRGAVAEVLARLL